MKSVTFITGNQNKADYLAKYLGVPVEHHKLDLDELQSLELSVIVEHKVKQAYELVKRPVLVEHGITRITNIHKNIPGVDAKLAAILAEHDLNVRGKGLLTKNNIGYAAFDVEGEISPEVLVQFKTLPSSIRTRILT